MKSSWICWLIAASLLAAAPADAGRRGKGGRSKERSADELLNVFLSPGYAQWLVGPIARLATEEEIEAFLEITDDEAAEGFIAEFWSRRRPVRGVPGMTARLQFEHLAEEADRRFGEETFPGRRTDRGTIFILYGPPDDVDYRRSRRERTGDVEVWRYERERLGLNGEEPKTAYYFVQDGDLTRFASGSELPELVP